MDQTLHLTHSASSPAFLSLGHQLSSPCGRFDSTRLPPSVFASTSRPPSQLLTEKPVDRPEKIRRILESDQRTDYEGQLLYEHIKTFPFFETLNEQKTNNHFEKNAFIYLCKKAKFEKHPFKKVLFQESNPSNGKMYLVYSGEVSIMSKKQASFYNIIDIKPQGSNSKEELDNNQDAREPLVSKHDIQATKPEILVTTFKDPNDLQDTRFSGLEPPSRQRRSKIGFLPTINKDSPVKIIMNEKEALKTGTDLFRRERRSIMLNRLSISPSPQLSVTPVQDEAKYSTKNSNRRTTLQLMGKRGTKLIHASQILQQPIQEEQLESTRSKTNTTLKHKFKAITRMTLSSIRMDRLNNSNLKSSASQSLDGSIIIEEAPEPPDFETYLADYGILVNKVEKGGSFGERAFFESQVRLETAIANTDCEFLVMNKRDFLYISQNYDSKRKHMIQFMIDFIPDVENIAAYDFLENLLNTLREKTYDRGSYVIQEGDTGDDFYVLCEGSCEIIKNIKVYDTVNPKDKSNTFKKMLRVGGTQNHQLPVCTIQKGVFIGEEILIKPKNTYDFSVKVTSAYAKAFAISKIDFIEKFPFTTNGEVHQIYNSKVTKYATLIKDLLAKRHPDMMLLQNTHTEKDLEQFLNHEQLLVSPKPKKGLQEVYLNTDYSSKSPGNNYECSPMKRQNTFLYKKAEESIASQSVELKKSATIAESLDITKIRRNINAFMRNPGSPHRTTQLISPSNTGLKVPILNVKEELRPSPSLALDISPINYKRAQDKRGYAISGQQSSIIKPISNDTETPQDKSRLLDLRTLTDSKLDLDTAEMGPLVASGEFGHHFNINKRSTYELDARDSLLLKQIPEEDSSTCKYEQSIRYNLTNSNFKRKESSLSPSSKQIDRVATLVKKAKSKASRKMIVGGQSLTCKASRRLQELDGASVWTEICSKSIVSPNQILDDSIVSKRNQITDRNSLITKGSNSKLKQRSDKNAIVIQEFGQITKEAAETKNSFEISKECLTSQDFYSVINEKPKGFKDRTRSQTHESILKMKHKTLLQIKRKAVRNSTRITENS